MTIPTNGNGKPVSIYDMKLHQVMGINGSQIMRVPGGWIYTLMIALGSKTTIQGTQVQFVSQFVPYSEDMRVEKEKS